MKFQIIWANNNDGTRFCLFIRPASFDVEKWAQSRQQAFRILGITGITVEEMEVSTCVQ
jgi:hypothetical protein